MQRAVILFTIWLTTCLPAAPGFSQSQILQRDVRHLRNGGPREWTEFPEQADAELRLIFSAQAGVLDHTLEFTQTDVKQLWHLLVNDVTVGSLVQDEKKLTSYLRIPASVLKDGDNVLTIRTAANVPDDIALDHIVLHRGSEANLMSGLIEIAIHGDDQSTLPGRITIVNERHSLQQVTVEGAGKFAVRPGCIYTPGPVTLRVPAPGTYTIYANHGFEYSVDSVVLQVKPGEIAKHFFSVRQEVDTKGWISSDTHVHTFTHSRHGDASVTERVLTLAGEGIDMPVITDHNLYVDLQPALDSIAHEHPDVRMSPVVGDELTTRVGHFNVFDLVQDTPVIDHRASNWKEVADALKVAGSGKVVILNHARDEHNDFRPFGFARHLSSAGLDAKGWSPPINAMEVINSGSQQSDFMLLFKDWFGMLNAGHRLTPIGSSDTHDVNRFIVGQGRTYVKGNDERADAIDIGEAIRSIRNGEVMVSCGLLTKILVNKLYGPGMLAKGSRRVHVRVEVLGPAWSNADTVTLFMNGLKIRQDWIAKNQGEPVRQLFSWDVDVPAHDVYFAAIAHGRVGHLPYWPIAKPYQPTSPDWTLRMYAGTGAVWVDANRNNRSESAADYAAVLVQRHGRDTPGLIGKLDAYDQAVAMQVAVLLWKSGADLRSEKMKAMLSHAKDHVRQGFAIVATEAEKIQE